MATPSLQELRVFETAVRAGSLSAAARELGITQQAVSARLRGLERLVELELVHRSPAGVTPTAAGDSVLVWAREVLAAAARLDESVAALRGDPTTAALAVAASQTVAAHLLPEWIVELRRSRLADERPAVDTALRTANSAEVIGYVRDGLVDLGFIEQPDAPEGLACAVVRRDRMIVAVSPDHPWATREAVALAEVAETPLVTREIGSGTRAAFETAALERLGTPPAAPLVSLSTEAAVRSAVMQGLAPAVLSELTVQDDLRLGRIRALQLDPPLTRPFAAVWRGPLGGARRELVSIASRTATA